MTTSHDAAAGIDAFNPFLGNHLGIQGLPAIEEAKVTEQAVTVSFTDGRSHSFHHQWLRHCCYCRQCGNPADGIRFMTVASFDGAISPESVGVADNHLEVRWPDGHNSRYGNDWLIHHAYDGSAATRRRAWRPTVWRSELSNDFPTVPWADATDGGEGQLRLYGLLRDYGIVQVDGMGDAPDRTEELADLMGPIHETTVYGRIYDVRAEPVAKLGAKTGMAQAPHIDDAFYYSAPGIDIFHCLVNTTTGGMSAYVDGFAIAESIKEQAPAAYRLLTTLPVAHVRRHPGEIDLRSRGPLISLDEFGQPCGIRYFDRALAPLDCAPENMNAFYNAIREFNMRMLSTEFVAEIRVAPGNGVLIDNHRIMHGRTAFDPSSGRHIRLCHVPRDEFHGRLRELSRTLDPAGHDLHLPQGAHTS